MADQIRDDCDDAVRDEQAKAAWLDDVQDRFGEVAVEVAAKYGRDVFEAAMLAGMLAAPTRENMTAVCEAYEAGLKQGRNRK